MCQSSAKSLWTASGSKNFAIKLGETFGKRQSELNRCSRSSTAPPQLRRPPVFTPPQHQPTCSGGRLHTQAAATFAITLNHLIMSSSHWTRGERSGGLAGGNWGNCHWQHLISAVSAQPAYLRSPRIPRNPESPGTSGTPDITDTLLHFC